jgi:DNA polymerase-3 subunit delta
MKEIKKQIKEKSFYKVYLLTGDEPYLILQAKHMLKNGMIREGDTMNYAEFTDAKVDINTLQELAFTYPFFSEKRLLLLDGTGILKTGKDEFVNIMDNMPETTCILICESEVDKRSKVYKWIKKNGYIGEFLKKNQTEKVLLRWIAALLGKEKKQIRENDAIYFLQKVGDDMFQIKNETDKLIAYVGEKEEITKEDIDELSIKKLESVIFDLTDNLGKKNIKQALEVLNNLLYSKEPIQKILITLYNHFKKLYIVKLSERFGKNLSDSLKLKPNQMFLINKYKMQANYFKEAELRKILSELINLDANYKIGLIDLNIGLESVLCRYCS